MEYIDFDTHRPLVKLFDVYFSIVQRIYSDLPHAVIFGLLLSILVEVRVSVSMHLPVDLGHSDFVDFLFHVTFLSMSSLNFCKRMIQIGKMIAKIKFKNSLGTTHSVRIKIIYLFTNRHITNREYLFYFVNFYSLN